jgi:pilus assembly protein Flp/PilA
MTMKDQIMKFLRDEDGLTMVEYAIAGSLVGLACVTAFTDLGTAIGNNITEIIGVVDPDFGG